MPETPAPEPRFVKVAECLYRNRSSGTYFALVRRKGKQIRKSLKTKDRKLAERRLRDFREKTGRLKASAAERKTMFRELADRWLKIHNVSLKPSSADRNRRCVKALNKIFGDKLVSDITRSECEDWMAQRSSGIAASTFNKDAEVLKGIFEYARQSRFILDNPALVIKRRRFVDREIMIPTREEYARLLEFLGEVGARADEAIRLVQILALSGMRLGEATRITTWREVDFVKGQFVVSGGDVGTKNHEVRIVPLFPRLGEFLGDLHRQEDPSPAGRIVGIASARSAMESACHKAKIHPCIHHSLRHFYFSNTIEVGVDFKTIANWIGHKDGGMLVAKTYGHLRQEHSL